MSGEFQLWLEIFYLPVVGALTTLAAAVAAGVLLLRVLWTGARRVCGYRRAHRLPDHYRADLYRRAAEAAWAERDQAQLVAQRAQDRARGWWATGEYRWIAAAADLEAALYGMHRAPAEADPETVALRVLADRLRADGHLPDGGER